MIETILNWALPFIIAPLAVVGGKLVLNIRHEIDGLPAWAKQLVIAGIAAGLTALAKVAEAPICGAAAQCTLDNLDVKAAVGALLAFALHAGLKKDRR